MSAAIWGELAIDPTTDVTAIKRAYARRLKLCRPEEDAAGFRRLRAAYEAALKLAQQAPASVLFTRPDAGAASPPPSPAPIRGLAAQPPPDAASACGPRRPAGGDPTSGSLTGNRVPAAAATLARGACGRRHAARRPARRRRLAAARAGETAPFRSARGCG